MSKRVDLRLFPYLLVSDVALSLVALGLARLARLHWPYGTALVHPKAAALNPAVYLAVALLWAFFFIGLSVYDPQRMGRLQQELWSIGLAFSASTAALAGVLYMTFRQVPRLLIVYFFGFGLVFLVAHRITFRLFLRLRSGGKPDPQRVLIVGAGKVGEEVADSVANSRRRRSGEVVGFVDDDPSKQGELVAGRSVLGDLDEITELIEAHDIEQVVFALPLWAHRRLIESVVELQRLPVDVMVVPDLFALAFARTIADEFHGFPVINLRGSAISEYDRVVKRVFDILVAVPLLLLVSPLMLLIAMLVKLDSPGPVIFRQERVGENGLHFIMYKFRTMHTDAEKHLGELIKTNSNGEIVFKHRDDPRVTRLGRFLRRYSLDELPQFLNVIKGEMSMVGPRPELPLLVDQYAPWQRRRWTVPPGITGWWQISGRSDNPMHLHVEDDLYYIANYSLNLDVAILLKTVRAVFRGRGAF